VKQLHIIGYWRSKSDTNWPDPAWFVDESLCTSAKDKMVSYLKRGYKMPYTTGGTSWCRFRCGHTFSSGNEYTDGQYVWPEQLWHYVEEHNVVLPLPMNEDFSNDSSHQTYSGSVKRALIKMLKAF
jgi:hypothetical protein